MNLLFHIDCMHHTNRRFNIFVQVKVPVTDYPDDFLEKALSLKQIVLEVGFNT